MPRVSRRAFALSLAAAGVAANVPAADPPPAPAPATTPEIEARVNWVVGKYGARLNDEQRADVRRLIASGQPGIDAMRAYPLDNSVEPATIFRVWRRQ